MVTPKATHSEFSLTDHYPTGLENLQEIRGQGILEDNTRHLGGIGDSARGRVQIPRVLLFIFHVSVVGATRAFNLRSYTDDEHRGVIGGICGYCRALKTTQI